MNINKLKLLISAVVCITNACNAYAISSTNVNTVSHEYCQQNRDVVKLPSPEILTTNNDSSSESLEIDISDDLNKSFYIPPSVDVLGQPIEDPKEHIVQKVQLSNPI